MLQDDTGALQIAHTIKKRGYKAYFVGGCVRDFLLGIDSKDIDIATDAHPDEVQRIFPFTISVGKQFGVIIVIKGKRHYEVATFRKDDTYIDGRHPSGVHFSTEEEDVLRRDFTINGLLYDPFQDRIIDYVGGQDDLKNGIIRTIGEAVKRFDEDKLRLLRGVRFAARLGFAIEDKTYSAMKSMAHCIGECSAERIRDELIYILTGNNPAQGLDLLEKTTLLHYVLPEVESLKNVEQPPAFHPEGDVFTHTSLMLANMKNPSKELAFAVLLHDIGKPLTFKIEDRIRFNGHEKTGVEIAETILTRLKFSNEEKERILDIVGNHMKFMYVKKMRISRLKRFLRKPFFHEHLELHRLDCIASHGGLDNYDFCKQKYTEFSQEETQFRPEPLVTGNTLISMGLTPGPVFKKILTALEDLQLEGKITSKEQAIHYVRENFLKND
ncbi:MAG: CCA tRNA nucleotidyltransferase [Spirochaetales bacterium]|nr:CCA tRNA nucleotidyltransferase [Spirochaetales bacterium]